MEQYFGDDIITKKNIKEAILDAKDDENWEIADAIKDILSTLHDYLDDGIILDEYFNEYMEQLCIDDGSVCESMSYYVNWDKYSDAVKMDYMSIDFGSLTYWVRK